MENYQRVVNGEICPCFTVVGWIDRMGIQVAKIGGFTDNNLDDWWTVNQCLFNGHSNYSKS